MNASEIWRPPDPTVEIQFWIYGILIPAISIPGLFANFVSAILFTRPLMRSSINTYLAGLACFDCCLLLLASLLYPPITFCGYGHDQACTFLCYTMRVTYPLSLIAQFGSVWACVAITVDRFIAVGFPFQNRRWCSVPRAWISVGFILCAAFLYNSPVFLELESHKENSSRLFPTDLRRNPTYILIYKANMHIGIYLIIPTAIMISLNAVVVWKIRKAFLDRRKLSASFRRSDRERRSTVVAVVVIATFLLCNIGPSINNYLEETGGVDIRPTAPGYVTKRTLVFLGNFFVCLNSASNFLIYCALGTQFRQMFSALFCPRLCSGTLRHRTHSQPSSSNLTNVNLTTLAVPFGPTKDKRFLMRIDAGKNKAQLTGSSRGMKTSIPDERLLGIVDRNEPLLAETTFSRHTSVDVVFCEV